MTGGRPGFVQVWASWKVGGFPPEAANTPEREEYHRETAELLATIPGAPPSFEWPDTPLDPESIAAMRAYREDGLPLIVEPAGVEFGSDAVPLLLDHVGAPVIEELEIACTGDRFSAMGWAHEGFLEALRARPGVSDGLRPTRARIVELAGAGIKFVSVDAAILAEVSLTANPLTSDTFSMVGDPGVKIWDRPTGERFSRTEEQGSVSLAFRGTVEVF